MLFYNMSVDPDCLPTSNILLLSEVVPTITFAVVHKTVSDIQTHGAEDHFINLDPIDISFNKFINLFYYHEFQFGMNYDVANSPAYHDYIALEYPQRKVNGQPFILYDNILINIEQDLKVQRDMLSETSLLKLKKDIFSLRTLAHVLKITNIVGALSWPEIVQAIKASIKFKPSTTGQDPPAEVNLVLSVIFDCPTTGTNPTHVHYCFHITDLPIC